MNEELRTYGLGAAVVLLLGAGIGFGLHYFVDGAGGKAAAAAVTPPAKQDATSPPVSCPPPQVEGQFSSPHRRRFIRGPTINPKQTASVH
jgi:hypothetical protein